MHKTVWGAFDAHLYLSEHRLETFGYSESEYIKNLFCSRDMYIPLAILEVSLRNTIHASLTEHFQRPDWWEALRSLPQASYLMMQVDSARKKVHAKKHTIPSIVAELNFGFWCSLFESKYEILLWKPLRLIFTGIEKKHRQRKPIRRLLEDIRLFRNRVYHYEPVLYKQPAKIHGDIETLLGWISVGAVEWMKSVDRVPEVITQKEEFR